jgi:hypothetical protein|tara:strand:+ start:55 stop:243 length:189 start_codon:yes stop_codon:yes gene_type:complete
MNESKVIERVKQQIRKQSQVITWDAKELFNFRECNNLNESSILIESLQNDLEKLKVLINLIK